MSRLKTSSSRSAKTSTSGFDKTKRRTHKSTPRRSASGSASSAHVTSSGPSPSSTPSATSSASSSATSASSMKNSASSSSSSTTAASSSPTSSTPTSTKECEQCGNQTLYEVGVNAKAVANSKKIAATATSGCQICDFVAFRKSQRHCVQCDKTQCEFFCEWCGHGFHAKCAKARGEHVDAVNGFCCKKCEAEQADDDDDDDEANDVNAKCGECKLPFNSVAEPAPAPTTSKGKSAAKTDATDHTGFKVNQSVLVENDEVLYNAVITDVDAKNERIKIHFLRWSKSFDDWYAMDDERINESLACDCCNRWFHIGCLPPIKSSGRFKDTTYVCPTCLDDAKLFYSGARSVTSSTTSSKATKTTSSASTTTSSSRARKGSNADEAPAVPASKKRSSKAIVPSDSEDDGEDEDNTTQEETKADEKDSRRAHKAKKEKEEASQSKAKKRKRSNSADSAASTASAQDKKKESGSPVRKSESSKSKSAASSRTKRERSSSHESDMVEKKDDKTEDVVVDEKTEAKKKASKQDETTASHEEETKKKGDEVSEKEEPKRDAASEEKAAAPSAPAPASSPNRSTPIATADAAASSEAPLSMEKPGIKRKVSGHSVSSLLNSPSSPPRRDSPALRSLDAPVSSSTRSSNSSVNVKVEKEPAHPTQPPAKKPHTSSRSNSGGSKVWVTGRDAKTAKAAAAAAAVSASPAHSAAITSSSTTGRGSLSAFDILREVAAQSMSDDLEASTPAPAPPAPTRKSQSRSKAAADRKLKADTTARTSTSNTSSKTDADKPTANGRTPPQGQSSSTSHAPIGVGIPMNSYVDLHFAIRKEMYLRICQLEDERLLERETAQLLRSMIYPTSDKFHDLKFVYVVNKELSSLQLTKRLLELVPITAGGTAPVIPVIPMRPSLGGIGTPLQTPAPPPSLIASSCNSSPVIRRPTPEPRTPPRSASPFVLDGGSASGTPQRSFQDIKPSATMAISNVTSSTSAVSSAASSSVAQPLLPPPLPAKLLLETMHLHSKLPTLLPPRAAPAVPASVTTTGNASASSSTLTPTISTQTTSTVGPLATISPAVVATQQHADAKAPSLVNTMPASTSISSN